MIDCISPLILSIVALVNICVVSVMLVRLIMLRGKGVKKSMKFYTFLSIWFYLALFFFVKFIEVDYIFSQQVHSMAEMCIRMMLSISTFAVLYLVIKKATK